MTLPRVQPYPLLSYDYYTTECTGPSRQFVVIIIGFFGIDYGRMPWREFKDLALASSRLEEAVIAATLSSYSATCDEESREMLINCTLAGVDFIEELFVYVWIRWSSQTILVRWRILWLLNELLDYGDNFALRSHLNHNLEKLSIVQDHPNTVYYARYLRERVKIAQKSGTDLVMQSEAECSNINGKLLSESIEDRLALLFILGQLKFFVDDFDQPVMIQTTRTIFDNYCRLFGCLTRLMVQLFQLCQRKEGRIILPDLLYQYHQQYLSVQNSFNEFLLVMGKIEPFLGRKVPQLLQLPPLHLPISE